MTAPRPPAAPADVLARLLARGALLVALAALVSVVVYALVAVVVRPWDTVEGEVLFEAERMRRGLSLYVDPVRGAFDYGPVPARYYVLYPPVWSWLLSHVPAGAASAVARAFDVAAWFGLLGWIALRAEPNCRRAAALAAACTAAVYTLTLFAVTGRPDALALLLAGLALERTARLGRVDPLSAVLFALAPWVKPNVVGMAAGAFVVDLVVRRARALGALSAALLTTGAMGVTLHVASGGAWIGHLLRSTGQPLSFALWRDQALSRLEFLGLPLGFAAYVGLSSRGKDRVALALGALGASIVWALVSLAKIGSASNYCIEPALAAVVVLAHAPVPTLQGHRRTVVLGVALAQALWDGVASVRSSYEELFVAFPGERRALARAREVCGAGPDDIVLGDETGIELELDGRIVETPFQMTHLARRGLYPLGNWIAEVKRPQIVGIVMEDDLLERPLTEVSVEHDRFGPQLRRVLRERFELVETNGGWRTYARKR
jgi:hypothetical protein